MSRHRLGIASIALLLTAGAFAPAAAQDRITLRYHPETRGQVPTRSWTDVEAKLAMAGMMEMVTAFAEGLAQAFGADTGEVSIRDSVEAAIDDMGQDSVSMHLQLVQTITEQLVQVDRRGARVRRVVVTDSARARTADGEWEEQDRVQYPATAADLLLDERMNILEFDAAGRDSTRGMLEGMLRGPSGFEVVFPEEPVAVGTGWTADMLLPFGSTAELTGGDAPMAGPEIMTHARFTLDSIVVRPADTLAYLSVVGMLEPATTSETEEGMLGTATVTGNFGGYLIWSTAWSAFVAGSSRFRMILDIQMEPAEEGAGMSIGFGMRMDLRNRFQVRP